MNIEIYINTYKYYIDIDKDRYSYKHRYRDTDNICIDTECKVYICRYIDIDIEMDV